MRYLGVDYGKKKIGLSFSEGQIASVYNVIFIKSLEDAVTKIISIIKKEEINRVVVGLPESGEARKITQSFITDLNQRLKDTQVEVIEVEETLSSFQARSLMHDLHLSQSSISKKEDEYAASIILQNFLDSLQ
jgi:putative transcription antitermination factor YqgF